MKKSWIVAVVVLSIFIAAQSAWAGTYVDNMLKAHKRGLTNIVTGVAEIPMGVMDAHGEGIVGLNYLGGLATGTGKAVVRILSGVWDIPAGLIPTLQEGLPPNPETLF